MGFGEWYHGAVGAIDRAADAGGHALGWAVGHGYSAITGDKAGGHAIEGKIDRAADRLFFDGHAPAGDNPADIYQWFHGPQAHGTGDYAHGETDLRAMAGTYQECETHARNAQAALRDGWSGSAAEAAQQNMTPIVTTAAAFHQHVATRQNSYGSQIPLWERTKNSVVLVPKDPPQANPLMVPMAVNPMTAGPAVMNAIDTDRQVTTYQQNAHQNQQAFSTYQPPTQQNAAAIPQQPGPVDPGRSDTGSAPPPPGGGVQPPPRTAWRPGSGGSTGGPGGASGGGHVGSGGGWTPPPGTGGYTGPGDSTSAAGYVPPTTTGAAAGTFDPTGAPAGGGAGYRPDGGSWHMFGPAGGASYGPGEGSGSVFARGGGASEDGWGARGGRFGAGADGGRFGSGAGTGTRGPGNAAGAAAEEEGMLRRGGVAGAAGRPGAAGTAGAGAMGAGGRGGRGEEDGEHRAAAYLVSEDNGNEIVGGLPLTAPPVIGE
ncbi:hypothetical protein [Gandjariella thermophila]|uniref:PPE family domain-containing protein n=1 Tax=Gandjariella thermophila TaxID=1931992 RepID=A0A4D4J994_9PSEU|nr:hypothetical protein [Gandjariella thermophila]GDY31580.1 hypothetical protein GTS_32130 [Gandjariella thermophila]